MVVVAGIMISELASVSVLQNKRKKEVDLESIGLMLEDIFNGMDNGINERGGVVEVLKVDSQFSVKGLCIANAMKILTVNMTEILVCSPWLFLLKKSMNSVGYICWRQTKTTLSALVKETIVRW